MKYIGIKLSICVVWLEKEKSPSPSIASAAIKKKKKGSHAEAKLWTKSAQRGGHGLENPQEMKLSPDRMVVETLSTSGSVSV